MADYWYGGTFKFTRRESAYDRWAEPWFADCVKCSARIRSGEKELAQEFVLRLATHRCSTN